MVAEHLDEAESFESDISDLVQNPPPMARAGPALAVIADAPVASPAIPPPPPLPIADAPDTLVSDMEALSMPSSGSAKLRRLELDRLIKEKELELLKAELAIDEEREAEDIRSRSDRQSRRPDRSLLTRRNLEALQKASIPSAKRSSPSDLDEMRASSVA